MDSRDAAAAAVLFKGSATRRTSLRKGGTHHTNTCGRPFVDARGQIHIHDVYRETTVDAEALIEIPGADREYDDRPRGWLAPAFTEDGTVCFATLTGGRIRAERDGQVIFDVNAGGDVSTPLVRTRDGRFVYGTRDGWLLALSADGKTHRVIACGDTEICSADDPPVFICAGAANEIYVETHLGSLSRVEADGTVSWSTPYEKATTEPLRRSPAPVITDDGSTIYRTNTFHRLIAIDAATGRERWQHRFNDRRASTPVARPTFDAQGNAYTLTEDGTGWCFSPDGKVVSQIRTNQAYRATNQFEPTIDLDADGHICMTPNPGHFLVYDAQGTELAHLETHDMFRAVDYIHGFSLSPDRTRAYIVSGAFGIAEVTLPSDSATRIALPDDTSPPSLTAAPTIEQKEDSVVIGGVVVKKRIS